MIKLIFITMLSEICALPPIKPPIPPGCVDIEPICLCDEYGQNCHYEWRCTKDLKDNKQ